MRLHAQVFGRSLPDDEQRRCWLITSGDDLRFGTTDIEHTVNPGQPSIPPSTSPTSAPGVGLGARTNRHHAPRPSTPSNSDGWVANATTAGSKSSRVNHLDST